MGIHFSKIPLPTIGLAAAISKEKSRITTGLAAAISKEKSRITTNVR
jgi:hypothetical protein